MPFWGDQINPQFVPNIANKYMLDGGIEAFDVFPSVSVKSRVGYVADYTLADWARIGTVDDYVVAGAVESQGDDYGVTKLPYYVKKFSFHKDVTEDEANEADSPIEPISDATSFVINRIKRVMLLNIVNTFLVTGVWTDNNQTAAKWDVDTTNIFKILRDEQLRVLKTTGYRPNRLVVTADVDNAIKGNALVTDKIKTTSDKFATDELVKAALDLKSYNVIGAINSGATDLIASKMALLSFCPDSPTKMAPAAGYHITQVAGRGGMMVQTRNIPMLHKNNSLRIEASVYTCPMKIAGDLGTLFYNCI